MRAAFLVTMFIFGACFGSFLCCQARRLHMRTRKKPKKINNRSICLHCKKQLAWYDNIPLLSWLMLRGKCRYCGRKIGYAELLSELGLGIGWVILSRNFNVLETDIFAWFNYITALALSLLLAFLAIYDGLYGELPTTILVASVIIALFLCLSTTCNNDNFTNLTLEAILSIIFSVLILGGLYLVLYLISKGKWVGDGDWLLGTSIGLALSSPWLALIALFIANSLACFYALPRLKNSKSLKIRLGPFLVTAFFLVYSFSDYFLSLI